MRHVREAVQRQGLHVQILIRKDDNKSIGNEVLHELLREGVDVRVVPNLHAKLYWSDAGAVISSMNLLETSILCSVEVSLLADADGAKEIKTWIDAHLARGTRLGESSREQLSGQAGTRNGLADRQRNTRGTCIRCGDEIAFNPERPFCRDCFESWAEYENPDYTEKRCHECGKQWDTSVAKPLCRGCYAQA